MADTHLILHVKGTERETTTLPKQVVRAAISQGQITHSQLIWSPEENTWKQVRQLPQLLPSQKIAPAPVPRVGTGALPKVAAASPTPTGTVPRVAAKPSVATPKAQAVPKVQGATPKVAVTAAAATPVARTAQAAPARATGNFVVKEKHESHPLKWLCIFLGVVILGAIGINLLLVNRPLTSQLSHTSFASVPVFAHLGAFMQPNVLVIHIPVTSTVTKDNLTDFLVALAQSTPQAPLSDRLYERVAITSGWIGQYSFSGYSWKQLGDMTNEDEAQRRDFILNSVGDAAGNSSMTNAPGLDDAALQAERDKVWEKFAAQFTRS